MGIGYVSEDKTNTALILSHDVKRNMSLSKSKAIDTLMDHQSKIWKYRPTVCKDLNIKVQMLINAQRR